MGGHPTAAFHSEAPKSDQSRYRIASENMATIVILGATGDLAGRKLIPAIYHLWKAGYLPKRIAVVGAARRAFSHSEFREMMCESLKKYSRASDEAMCDPFVSNLYYAQLRFDEPDDYAALAKSLERIESEIGLPGQRLVYLSTAPSFFGSAVEHLGRAGIVSRGDHTAGRVVFEKPFGHDLESARGLNDQVQAVLREEQIYRIDHYLGKETVQNIFAFRFGNAIFEPLFNQRYVDHVQITVSETLGMEGRRGAFYDATGALRDVVQNHALQLMCLVAMEAPARYEAKDIRDEKVKVLNSVRLPSDEALEKWAVRGQYAEGAETLGYLSEEGVSAESVTDTFAALRLYVDNWRWAGVPFFIRTGKRLKSRVTEIAIQFRQPPMHYFEDLGAPVPPPNLLVFRIQPDEAISLRFCAKPPGMEFQIEPVDMNFTYGGTFEDDLPEAYERLLLDALRGESTLFMREDEIDVAWRIVTDVMRAWETAPAPNLYRPFTWGPPEADTLFEACQGAWREPDA